MMEKQVLEFLKIVKMTQTNSFHQWNVESIRRSFEWAQMIEKIYATHDPKAQSNLEEKYFKYVQFPMDQSTGKKSKSFSIDILKFASWQLCSAMMTSPFLSSHPIRSEILQQIIELSTKSRRTKKANLSRVVTYELQQRKYTQALLNIAEELSQNAKSVKVEVCSVLLEIQPRERYYGRKSTLLNQSMAQSIVMNALFCKSISNEMYTEWLQDYSKTLELEEALVEIAGLMLLMEQSNEHLIVEKDLFVIWKEQVMRHPTSLWNLDSWLLTDLCVKFPDFGPLYLSYLFTSGIMSLEPKDLTQRIGTLIFSCEKLQRPLHQNLENLDIIVKNRVLQLN